MAQQASFEGVFDLKEHLTKYNFTAYDKIQQRLDNGEITLKDILDYRYSVKLT